MPASASLARAFFVGGVVMLVVERLRPAPDVVDAERHSGRPRAGGRVRSDTGADSGRLALGRHDRRRDAPRHRSSRGGRVLVLPRDADDDGGVRARAAGRPSRSVVGARRRDQRRLRDGVSRVALLVVKPFLHYVRRSGFAPFAWYRIALGIVLLVAVAAGRT